MASKPTYEQAQLHLQLYEERREPRLRQARDWFWANCYADTLDEAMRIAPPGTEAGTSFMMVISYWDQACALLNYGLLHEDLFFETNGEFFGVWDRIRPTIKEGRERFSNRLFAAHIEKAANRFETWAENNSPGMIVSMRQMNQQMRAQTQKKKSGLISGCLNYRPTDHPLIMAAGSTTQVLPAASLIELA